MQGGTGTNSAFQGLSCLGTQPAPFPRGFPLPGKELLELGATGPCSGVVLNTRELSSSLCETTHIHSQLFYPSIVCCDDLCHYLSATAAGTASHI